MKLHKKSNDCEVNVVEIKGKNNTRLFMSEEAYNDQQKLKKSRFKFFFFIFLFTGVALCVYIYKFFLWMLNRQA